MRSKDIIAALEDTDDKYIDSAIEFMAESRPSRSSGLFSVLKFAGAAAAVIAVVLAIWIPLKQFPRDPEPLQYLAEALKEGRIVDGWYPKY